MCMYILFCFPTLRGRLCFEGDFCDGLIFLLMLPSYLLACNALLVKYVIAFWKSIRVEEVAFTYISGLLLIFAVLLVQDRLVLRYYIPVDEP